MSYTFTDKDMVNSTRMICFEFGTFHRLIYAEICDVKLLRECALCDQLACKTSF